MDASTPRRGGSRFARSLARPRGSDLVRGLVALVASALGLALADLVLGDLTIDGIGPLLLLALAMAVVGAFLRPALVALATLLGWPGAVLLALFGQAAVVAVAVAVVPGASATFWGAFWGGWIVAVITTLVGWVATAGTSDALLAHVARRARRAPDVPDPEVPGVLFVQLDGVPYPVLEWGVRALRGADGTCVRIAESIGRWRVIDAHLRRCGRMPKQLVARPRETGHLVQISSRRRRCLLRKNGGRFTGGSLSCSPGRAPSRSPGR